MLNNFGGLFIIIIKASTNHPGKGKTPLTSKGLIDNKSAERKNKTRDKVKKETRHNQRDKSKVLMKDLNALKPTLANTALSKVFHIPTTETQLQSTKLVGPISHRYKSTVMQRRRESCNHRV